MPIPRPQPLPFTKPGDIRRLRTTLALTQEQLAEQMQVTPLTIGRWESGQSKPRPIYLKQLRELEAEAAAASAAHGPQPTQQLDAAPPQLDFAGDPKAVSAVAEAWHLAYGHQFNPTFASEISRIDPLPHQRIAVYEHMLRQAPLRFLLADDAGAGKTIMTGLTVREMLLRGRIRRVLVVPPAGLVGNWQRELQTLFGLSFRIVTGAEARAGNPFRGPGSDLAIVSIDTLVGRHTFARLCETDAPPYDLVVFDEAHKLSASTNRRRANAPHKSQRYQLAEGIAGCAAPSSDYAALPWACRHLLLLTATPHMGYDSPYHHLWRLLDPHVFATGEALRRFPETERPRHFLRRTKEEMVDLQGNPLYPPRECSTFSYELSQGPNGEQALYDDTTEYLLSAYSAMDNEGAMRLALGVFQRRLASSAFALSRSLERRIDKLRQTAKQLASGELTPHEVQQRQRRLRQSHTVDYFEQHTADEDGAGVGTEANEDYETAVLGAIVTVSIEALEQEIETLTRLNRRAKAILDSGSESKFEKLRQALEDPSNASEKWIIFTEHRDTMDYLVRRLEGLGHTGEVAQIHGGMAWPEREEQVEAFRRPDGARYLVATDAAGEGINLQFCSYMANYDLPWNPARLEQRMGRIHRYGQSRKVHIANLVAASTREGRVLEVLLDKLDTIRQELHSDKVFDVIGRLFDNASLSDVMVKALTDEEAAKALLEPLAAKSVTAISEEDVATYGKTGDVASRLAGLRSDMDRERYLQLLPAQVRRFVIHSAALLNLDIRGDINEVFSLAPLRPGAMDPLLPALSTYPATTRNRLSTQRVSGEAESIWVHPGEPVFEALAQEVIRRFGPDALRGTILVDPRASEAYMLHVALASVEAADDPPMQEMPANQTLEHRLLAVRQQADGTCEATDIEPLLLLHGSRRIAPGAVPLASRGIGMKADAGEFLQQHADANLAEKHRDSLRLELPERRRRVAAGFDLQLSELAQSRRDLRKRAVNDAQAEAREAALETIKEEQEGVRRAREQALANLETGSEHIGVRDVRFLAHVLVVPATTEDDVAQYDESVEDFAVRIATEWERQRESEVRDVSKPHLARDAGLQDYPGFDLQARLSDGGKRAIEVKGRSGRDAIQMEWNEWKQACNLGEEYWLYAVLDCATPSPQLIRIQDPFRKLLAKEQETSTYSISAKSLLAAAETDSQEPGGQTPIYTRRTLATVKAGQ